MFSFWNRKASKSPAAGRTPISLPQTSQGLELPHSAPKPSHRHSFSPQEEAPPIQTPPKGPEPEIAAVPNPHDDAVSEVQAKLLQVEQLPPITYPSRSSSKEPLFDTQKQQPEPLFDPATGAQRGFFEPHPVNASTDSEQICDETWSHLSRIRELQSEIAAMHVQMEGIGDGANSIDVEVDVDIDVDTVPTQEEEEAAMREKEFAQLPSRFKGRKDKIDSMMIKLDELSQVVTSFHALEPPPLSFESPASTRENTRPDMPTPLGEHTTSVAGRTRAGLPPTVLFGSRIGPDQAQITEVLHDSPISTPTHLHPENPAKS